MSHQHHIISRRAFTTGAIGGAIGASALGPQVLAQVITAESPIGPWYPVGYRGESDADLTRVAGHSERAIGQIIEISGRVLDKRGNPINGARLDIWQANAAGRYTNPNAPDNAPLDPGFQGYASVHTGIDGSWAITTVKPGGYDALIGHRPPHIHMDVFGMSSRNMLQMYFPEDDAGNRADALYQGLGADAPTSVANALGDHRYKWDIVLIEG